MLAAFVIDKGQLVRGADLFEHHVGGQIGQSRIIIYHIVPIAFLKGFRKGPEPISHIIKPTVIGLLRGIITKDVALNTAFIIKGAFLSIDGLGKESGMAGLQPGGDLVFSQLGELFRSRLNYLSRF